MVDLEIVKRKNREGEGAVWDVTRGTCTRSGDWCGAHADDANSGVVGGWKRRSMHSIKAVGCKSAGADRNTPVGQGLG